MRTTAKIALLALIVLAVHLWLLGARPGAIAPAAKSGAFMTRTVTPPIAPPVAASVAPKATRRAPVVAAAVPTATATVPAKQVHEIASLAADSPRFAQAPAAGASEPAPAAATHSAGAASAPRVAVAPSAIYRYDVIASGKGLTLHGNAVLEWRNVNGEYEAQLSTSSPIPFVRPRTQRSVGLITAQGLAPVRFSDKSKSEEAAHFDREGGKVTFSTNKPDAPLEPGAQDRLSIVMQLSAMLAGDPSKYITGSTITIQTASTKEAEPWTFTVEGVESLDLPGGRMQAVRLARNPRREYDVKVELWLAPGSAYAPVRLRLTQPNGDWVDQQWSSTDRG